MALVSRHLVLDEILDGHADRAGGNEKGYAGLRAHAYRVFNFSRELAAGDSRPDDDDKLAIAAGFHDLGAFASLDYLGPSIAAMTTWLEKTGREAWREELAVVCAHHHKLTAYRGPHARLTEPFRRADWCEVLQCTARYGVPRPLIREAVAEFPRGNFFTKTVPTALGKHVVRHPLDPVPILRGRRALAQNGVKAT